jgi:hypothetical protein
MMVMSRPRVTALLAIGYSLLVACGVVAITPVTSWQAVRPAASSFVAKSSLAAGSLACILGVDSDM